MPGFIGFTHWVRGVSTAEFSTSVSSVSSVVFIPGFRFSHTRLDRV